ncbi:unnamed protein product [Porites evermanni]|uniref:DUF4283 domain-containing protein n=1 Tax=Porites evermanni TaxID=104178 RepID=A0ABN8N0U5_9CNID|nr:unnamed protein product [Porites evermanni]
MWKQRRELLFTGPMAKIDEEIKCKHLLYWSGEQGIEVFNSWDLSADDQKQLDNYWERIEHSWPKEALRVLGNYISYDEKQNEEFNFIGKMQKLDIILGIWNSRNLTLLGEHVVMFQPQIKTWISAEVKEETGIPRSYIVKKTGGSEVRRNRVQLKPLQKTPITCEVVSNQESTLPDRHETKPPPSPIPSSELPQAPAQSLVPSNQSNDNLP